MRRRAGNHLDRLLHQEAEAGPQTDPDLGPLADLGERLTATAPRASMDPAFRRTLRAELLAAHQGHRRQASLPGRDAALHYSTFATPFGTLYIAYSGETVRYSDLGDGGDGSSSGSLLFQRECLARFGLKPEWRDRPPERLRRAVVAWLEGKGRYHGPLDLSGMPEFQQRVLRKTLEIRRGEVRTYGWVAREIGAPRAVRAVGTALARNPIPLLIPCHRVVRSDYRIGEYGCGGPDKKRQILQAEEVDVARLERLERQGIRYQGSRTSRIFCLPSCYTGRRTREENRVYFPSEEAARARGFRPCRVCRPA